MRRFLLVALLLGACASTVEPEATTTVPTTTAVAPTATTTDPSGDDLDSARARWKAAALGSYHFVFQDDCGECMPEWAAPRLITVWDGETFDGRGQHVDVGAMFAMIEAATADGQDVDVTYHPELGYPVDVWIDQEARAYDGGTHLLIHELSAGLPGTDVALADLEAAWSQWTATRPASYEFRTDIVCGCPFDASTWTVVDGDRVIDWEVEVGNADVAPLTIDMLFADLHNLISEGEVVEGGARITGTASYHPELGYPVWVGLDIEILDPDSELGELPPRLVFAVRDLVEHEASAAHERARARWKEVGPTDYEYELTIHDIEEGSFSEPHLVVVMGGVLASVTLGGEDVHPDNVPAFAITELFELIDMWVGLGFEVDVIYNDRLGHPVLVITDHDGEITSISIANLRPR